MPRKPKLPQKQSPQWKIYNDDVVTWAKDYDKTKFHALLCDPPYHLESIVKRFGKKDSAPAKYGTDGVFTRSGTGFMGQTWDGGNVAFDPETWKAIGNVLMDGAFGMAFSASRNWHRLAVAIEDAGFIIHPTIFLWAYGSGFPKATRIDKKAKDKNWEGHRYGLQALKPAVEPIIVFQKPFNGKPLDNITQTGAGSLNIDGGRIPTQDEYVINQFDDGMKPFGNGAGHKYSSIKIPKSNPKNRKGIVGTDLGISNADINKFQDAQRLSVEKANTLGRWPANFVLDKEAAEHLDKQTGVLVSNSGKPFVRHISEQDGPASMKVADGPSEGYYGDSGGASRFFYTVSDKIDESDPVYYCSKTSQKERKAGLNIKNVHPTLKPIDLCKYLATLLLPPDAYAPRKILVPFSGSGSEMIGAGLAGWDIICGVEFDTKNRYVDIAEKRLEHWLNQK